MNILILHTASDLYGASKILLIVTEILQRNNYKPIVVLSGDGPLVAELNKLNVEVHIIRLGILRRKYFNVSGMLNRVSVSFKAWRMLSRLISEKQPEIIYSNTTGVIIGALLAWKKGIRHIWHVHEIITKPAAFTRIIGYLLNTFSDKVIVVSDAVKKHWQQTVDPSKIARIYNGIDISPFSDKSSSLRQELKIPEDVVLIGMIGRVNHWKGQNYFLEIARILSDKYPSICFIMAGDAFPGNEHLVEELNANIKGLQLEQKVFNIGYRTDIVNILNALDIFVLPSIQPDPFPTVILEAMSAGKPVIATNHGGAPEMIEDGKSGLLIPVADAGKAAEKACLLIENELLRKEMGIKARERVQEVFSKEAFEKGILGVIKGD